MVKKVFGFEHTLPVHQGRAAEHLLVKVFLKPPQVVLTNYHFPSTRVHVEIVGSQILDLVADEALIPAGDNPFKGNIDHRKAPEGHRRVWPGEGRLYPHGGHDQPDRRPALLHAEPPGREGNRHGRHGLLLVLDGSLIGENAYFIKQREAGYADKSIQEILLEMMGMVDIFYMSGRKSGGARGGLIATNNKQHFDHLMTWLPVYEGFSTYGGMSTKEIEAMAVGLEEMTQTEVAGSSPEFIQYFAERLQEYGIPVVTPPGGLACHVDARAFLPVSRRSSIRRSPSMRPCT